jgi:RNA polymerase sigma factor (sigma-70 family)
MIRRIPTPTPSGAHAVEVATPTPSGRVEPSWQLSRNPRGGGRVIQAMGSLVSRPSTLLLRSQSDERLLALAREGHERAFEAIVERYRRPLLRACRRVLPEARAEDAVQQALVAVWTALEHGHEVRELRPWLFRVAHNTALNQLRMNGYDHDELVEGLRGGRAPDEELERRIVVRATLAGIAALPERQREALLRIAVEGRTQEDVAAELGVSEGAVRQLVHRARVQLRAAATAVTPMPLAIWMADLAGGAATAGGAAATAVKAGAAVVLVTGAAAGPALIQDRPAHGGRRDAAVASLRPHARPAETADDTAAAATPVHTAAVPRRDPDAADAHGGARRRGGDEASGADRRGRDDRGSDSSGSSRSSGSRRSSGSDDGPSGPGGPGPSPSRDGGERSGSSGDDGAERLSGTSGSPDGGDRHDGRSGGGDDGAVAPTTAVAVATPTADDGHSGSDSPATSDTSGSGDSGSGGGDRTVLEDTSSHSGGGDGSSSGTD